MVSFQSCKLKSTLHNFLIDAFLWLKIILVFCLLAGRPGACTPAYATWTKRAFLCPLQQRVRHRSWAVALFKPLFGWLIQLLWTASRCIACVPSFTSGTMKWSVLLSGSWIQKRFRASQPKISLVACATSLPAALTKVFSMIVFGDILLPRTARGSCACKVFRINSYRPDSENFHFFNLFVSKHS